ncbi:MAG: hypothetical protein JKY95_11750 [Planctomycetaceae bacterium]|nr:hypothetical protein [Planctomycetaceae bacterium]
MSEPPPLPLESEVDSVSIAASKSQSQGRIFPCGQCGADVVFHIGSQQLKCPYCSHEQQLTIDGEEDLQERDYHEELQRLLELNNDQSESLTGLQKVHCDACNGTVVFEAAQTSTHCPYCNSPIQLDQIHEHESRISPDGVLPFQITREQAQLRLAKWVKSLWFAPNDFKKQGAQGKFNGVYLPYWTFDSFTANSYRGQRGVTYTVTVGTGKNRRTVTKVRWYSASGSFQRFFDDVLIPASTGLSPKLTQGIEPWPLHKTLPFTREVLAGYLARTYEVELDDGFIKAKDRMADAIHSDVRRRIGGDRQRIHHINTDHSAITFKYMILPVWLLSYRYKGKVYQLMTNAATGKVAGNRPYSWWKIAGAVLLGGALVAGLLFLFSR